MGVRHWRRKSISADFRTGTSQIPTMKYCNTLPEHETLNQCRVELDVGPSSTALAKYQHQHRHWFNFSCLLDTLSVEYKLLNNVCWELSTDILMTRINIKTYQKLLFTWYVIRLLCGYCKYLSVSQYSAKKKHRFSAGSTLGQHLWIWHSTEATVC